MAVGQYDQPGQHQFLNTYVPIPFQEMAGALQMRQKQYEQGAAQRDAFFTAMKDVELASPDEPEYQNRMRQLDSDIAGLLEENPDMGSLEFKTGLNKIIRTQGRDPWWRQAAKNKPIYEDLLKKYSEAAATGKPWNYVPLQRQLEEFRAGGTGAVGELFPMEASQAGDIITEADALGKGFRTEGSIWARDVNDGTLRVRQGQEGVALAEVAGLYGYEVDKNGQLTLVQPNIGLMQGEGGLDMQRQAQMLAEQTGQDPQEVFNQLYDATIRPLVSKYAGVKTTDSQTITKRGFDRMERADLSFDYYLNNVRRMTGENEFGGKRGVLAKAQQLAAASLMTNPIFSAKMKVLDLATGGRSGEIVESFFGSGAKDYKERGLSKEEAVAEIQGQADQILGAMETGGTVFSPVVAAVRTWASSKKVAIEMQYDNVAPDAPSEDYLAIANRHLQNTTGYSSKEYGNLGSEEQDKLHNELGKSWKDWDKEGVRIGVRAVDPKTKAQSATMLFGYATDNGIVTGEQIGGPITDFLIFDPEEPSRQITIDEDVKKDDRIEYIGPVSKDNVYGPGLHAIKVNDKTYFTQITGVNASPSHPLYNRDHDGEALDNALYDFNKHRSGIGDWFNAGNFQYRTVVDEWDNNNEVSKVHIEYAPKSGDLSRAAVPGGNRTSSIKLSELEGEFGSLYGKLGQ